MALRFKTVHFPDRNNMQRQTARMIGEGWMVQRVTALSSDSREVVFARQDPEATRPAQGESEVDDHA